MSEERSIPLGRMEGFVGDDRESPEHLMVSNASPDSLNIDYTRGTLKPRPGVVRLHGEALLAGGVRVSDANVLRLPKTADTYGQGTIDIGDHASYHFAGDFCYELIALTSFPRVDANYKFLLRHSDGDHDTTPTTGVSIYLKKVASDYHWAAAVGHTGGVTVEVVAGTAVVSGQAYYLSVRLDSATGVFRLYVDGLNYTASAFPGGQTFQWGSDFVLGDTKGSDAAIWFLVDELRVWGIKTPAVNLHTTRRELTAAEQTSDLKGYWQFEAGALGTDTKGVNNASVGPRCYAARGFVSGRANQARVTGLQAVLGQRPLQQCLVCTATDVYRLDVVSGAMTWLYNCAAASNGRWQSAYIFNFAFLVNGVGENLRYSPTGGLRLASLQEPAVNYTVAQAVNAGGAVDVGVHRYQFTYWDNVSKVESRTGLFEVSVNVATPGTQTVVLGDATDPLPNTDQIGVTHLRIYRTTAGGSTFYLAGDVAIGTVSFTDTAADSANLTPLNPYTGYALPAAAVLEHDERVWLLGPSDNPTRALYTEKGETGSYYKNNYVEVGPGDGEQLTGGVSVGGVLLLFKEQSIWALQGSGSTAYARRIYDGGCVAGASLAATNEAVYYLGAQGVGGLAVGGGAAPEDLSEATHRAFFAELAESEFAGAAGAWDKAGKRYLLAFTLDGDPVTMVWSPRRKTWAKWDLDAGVLRTIYPNGQRPELWVGWRGYVARLSGLNEGVDVAGETAATLRGTVTGGGAGYLEASGAAFRTAGTGLRDVDVTLVRADASRETRRVWWNTATRLEVSVDWSTAPAAGDRFVLGALECRWRSPKALLDDGLAEKALMRLQALLEAVAAPATVVLYHQAEGSAAKEQALATDARYAEKPCSAPARGRLACVGLSAQLAGETFEVSALAATMQQKMVNPGA